MKHRRQSDLKSKRRRKHKRILVFEIVILILLVGVLAIAVWGTQMLGLVNTYELDESKVITATEANQALGEDTETVETEDDDDEENDTTDTTSQYTGYDIIALVGLDTRADAEGDDVSYNSDTMIICVIDHNNKAIRLCSIYRDTYLNVGESYYGDENYYTKANSAYNWGGPEQMLTMLNLNLDLDITDFITVDFTALTECIDLLGGLDIEMTREEVIHLNNYNIETAASAGVEYEALEIPDDPNFDGDVKLTFHCNGSQAVSYARIRYTAGNDYRRASRQREVLSLIKEKASQADILTLTSVIESVLPSVTTNMSGTDLISLAINILSYDMGDENMGGFPFVRAEDEGGEWTGYDCVIPVTLEYNVELLHEFLFPDEEYSTSVIVKQYSAQIEANSGLTSDDIEYYASLDYNEELGGISYEDYIALLEEEEG